MTAFGETHIAIHYQGWILLHVSYTLKPGEKALRDSGSSTISRWNRAYERNLMRSWLNTQDGLRRRKAVLEKLG